jgi:hypothetical protein
MDSKLDTVNEATNNDEQVFDPPRKAEKKVVKGKASMAPPHQEHHEPCQMLSEALNAHDFSQSGSRLPGEKTPGPNASCSATSPRVAKKPRPIPVIWDNYDARHKEFAYDDPRPTQFSQDFDPHRGFNSFYGNYPFRPFMSDLSVMASSQRQPGSLQDVVRQEVIRKVSFCF